jgi:hypothetical protein
MNAFAALDGPPAPWKIRCDGPTGKLVERHQDETAARRRANVQWRYRRATGGGTVTLYRYDSADDMYVIEQTAVA